MPRHANGTGSLYRRRDGRWVAALSLGGRRVVRYARTRAAAQAHLQALQAQHAAGRLVAPHALTLGAYLADWLERAALRLRPTTLAEYRALAGHSTRALGEVRLTRLEPLHLARFEAALARARSPRRAAQAHQFLHKALGDAVRLGLLAQNPADRVDPPRATRCPPPLWTPDQVRAARAALEAGAGGTYGPLFAFLLASGCRLGEALGLAWGDVDWAGGAVRLTRQVVTLRGGQVYTGPPKSRAGVRTVALPAWGLEALRRQRAQQAAARLRAGGWEDPGARVFTTARGTVPRRENVLRAFHAFQDRLGLPRLRLHDLRHLHLSLLAMAGVPLRVAQQRAGHAQAGTTLAVYQHVLGDADRQAARALD